MILYYKNFGETLSIPKAFKLADNEIIKVKDGIEKYENLIYNTNIGNHSICFITFYEELKLKNGLKEFAVFSEFDPFYFEPKSLNILVQRPGYYYFEFPDDIIIDLKNIDIFCSVNIFKRNLKR